MAIERVKCRARVQVAGVTAETPYVQSFNVTKQRGQISTFSASLKILASDAGDLAGGAVKIWAGQDSANTLIFTGVCKAAKISPCFDDPQYVMLSIGGSDKLMMLEGKKFTRRCRATHASWCAITGVVRKGLKSGKFATNFREPILEISDGTLEKQNTLTGYRPVNSIDSQKHSSSGGGDSARSATIHVSDYDEGNYSPSGP
jgi:hypothetical protein